MDITTQDAPPPAPPSEGERKRAARGATRPGDRVFLGFARGSGIFLLVVMAAIAAFLTWRAVIAISDDTTTLPTATTLITRRHVTGTRS